MNLPLQIAVRLIATALDLENGLREPDITRVRRSGTRGHSVTEANRNRERYAEPRNVVFSMVRRDYEWRNP